MDGGILDNQGIEGVKLAERRHVADGIGLIGTYIISDVSGEIMEPLEVPELEYSRLGNFLTFRSINLVAGLVMAAAVALLFVWDAPPWDIVLVSVLGTLIVAWFAFFVSARRVFIREVSKTFAGGQLPEILKDFGVLTRTPIYVLFYLVKFRGLSVLKMVMDVFLRRIRRLQLDALFASLKWNGRVKTNNIYKLKGSRLNEIGSKMIRVIDHANKMPTTLWFSEEEKREHMLDDLIAAGQCTLCYNLISYIEQLPKKTYNGHNIWETVGEEDREKIEVLKKQLDNYWIDFTKDPYWLLNMDKSNTGEEV